MIAGQISTQQIPQEHDAENILSIFLCLHLQDIVKARTCMILILIGILRVISLYVLYRGIN
jgi:hypothetical protein